MPESTPPASTKGANSTPNAVARPNPGPSPSPEAVTPEPVVVKLPPFVVEHYGSFILGSTPISGHFKLDFSTPEGRLHARNLAHDLLLAISDAEANETAETDVKIGKLTNILLATTDIPEAEAREQAQALFDAGVVFRK